MADKKQWSVVQIIVVTILGVLGLFLLVGVLGVLLLGITTGSRDSGVNNPVQVSQVPAPSQTG